VDIIIDGPTWLVIRQQLPAIPADDALAWFVDPAKLAQWWGDEFRIDATTGGEWIIAWPRLGKTLRGTIAALSSRDLLVSWIFDEEEGAVPRALSVVATAAETGALIEIRHGPYLASDAAERDGHREGWAFFLPRLVTAATG
jgi:uncharacterized protein YndB with AHSA1/START domain